MPLESGSSLGTYEISDLLGKGGMGEVYRARDTKLGRQVAIKTLPDEFARDADRVARFQREAKMLASLNHPNIAAIYGLEEHEGSQFLVLELVEGETLADVLKRGPLPVVESLKLALQIAEALEAAHEKAVVHRDLKPANIKVTPDGKVKVLDFGLAKAFVGAESDISLSNSPTLSMQATQAGIILGTAAYMSPEQASGEATDRRADIWAFGVVLFEMLSGRQLFDAKTVPRILAAVLNNEPEWNSLPANLHPRIRVLLERLLEKEAQDRLSGISDARVEIQKVLADGVFLNPALTQEVPTPRSRWPWVASIVLGMAVAGIAVWNLKPESRPITRFDYELPDGVRFISTGWPVVDISPAGDQFLYIGGDEGSPEAGIYLRAMKDFDAHLIAGITGNGSGPIFSPDGQEVAYFTSGSLIKISIGGGAPIVIAESIENPYGMSWDQSGTILYAQRDGIWRVPDTGGPPEHLIVIDAGQQAKGPQLLPDGEWVLFTLADVAASSLRWDEADIVIESLVTEERRVLRPGGSDARYVPTGHLVYALGNTLFAEPFDLASMALSGGPASMIQGVRRADDPANTTGSAFYSFSNDGTLIYVPGTGAASQERGLALVNRDGTAELLDVPPASYSAPRVSADGRQVAVSVDVDGISVISVYDLSGQSEIRRLTFEGSNRYPVWTPDGESLTFASDRGGEGNFSLYQMRADGTGQAQRLTTADAGSDHEPESYSADGTLSFRSGGGLGVSSTWSVWTLAAGDGAEPELFLDLDGTQRGSEFSPDGNWIAYFSDHTGSPEIYVEPFPATGGVGRNQITAQTGTALWPVWTPDGNQLIWRLGSELIAVDINTTPPVRWGETQTLPISTLNPPRHFDILPDGERFVVVVPLDDEQGDAAGSASPQINIVLNWFEELKERVPIP